MERIGSIMPDLFFPKESIHIIMGKGNYISKTDKIFQTKFNPQLYSVVAFLLSCMSFVGCNPKSLGSYDLGDGIYLMDFDYGKIIVHGTSVHFGICYGGEYLIPTYEMAFDSTGKRKTCVLDAVADNNWVIAKLYDKIEQKDRFAVLSKSLLQFETESWHKYIEYFDQESEFQRYCDSLRIDIGFAQDSERR